MEALWIPNDFLSWPIFCEASSSVDIHILNRAYEIWEHAKTLIEQGQNSFSMSDGILNLKRCLNQRIRAIKALYPIDKIEFPGKLKGDFELFEFYGLAKPFLLKNLLDIRNAIEHSDAPPPSWERCRELLDIVWYFLKSTDGLVRSVKTDFYFEEYFESPYSIIFEMDYQPHRQFAFWGWFPADQVFREYAVSRVPINAHSVRTAEQLSNKFQKNRLDTDLCIDGFFKMDGLLYSRIIKRCFNAY
ncbi:hypothetical protein SAMN05216343_104175 [Oscillibacter sp. PC13]|uniref:hypothetical protein n=1 Tax=Oscillibacter sp. PC13 TaxID=1855299 RepID=UPI0008EF766D|nr:hypothetical protein [Oscillibacter sp. PC13]SFP22881.1 hypothetical protein SAMN05216343_104175 [Oscillibacter sp. PC13]